MDKLREILEERFKKNIRIHEDINFPDVWDTIFNDKNLYDIILKMEETGGEPDFIKIDGKIIAFDSYQKLGDFRKSLCYDKKALDKRKKNKPRSDVMTQVEMIGSKLLTEEVYRKIQELYKFDEKISSWVLTPKEIRDLGGAIFCDRRYERVFTYHNSAESYYASRGFRTYVLIKE